jgi:hypothetical protein
VPHGVEPRRGIHHTTAGQHDVEALQRLGAHIDSNRKGKREERKRN